MSIKNLIELRNSKYNLRGWYRLFIPNLNSIKHGLKSFKYYAAKQWNALPKQIREMAGSRPFELTVKTIVF